MNRNHLALFHIVAQAGGISHGAKRAHVSQPAVSKQLKELEDFLGVKLLERLPRGSRLTDAGRLLAGYAQRLSTLEQDAARAIEEFRGLKRGRLSIGASTTVGTYLLPQLLGKFHSLHPTIELNLQIANTSDIQHLLTNGTVEIALTEGLIESRELDSEIFHQDELVAIAAPKYPLLKKKKITIHDLCQEPFIMREEGSGTRAVAERAFEKRGFPLKPILSLASTEAIKHAVATGIGISIVSRLTIDLELKFGSLALIPISPAKDFAISRPLHLQRLRGREHSPLMQRFLSLL